MVLHSASTRLCSAKHALIAAALLMHVTSFRTAAATPEYHLTDLGNLGGRLLLGAETTGKTGDVSDINNVGQVVGAGYLSDDTTSRAFLYQNGTMTRVLLTGKEALVANRINDRGHIMGTYAGPQSGGSQYFLLADGVATPLPLYPGLTYVAFPLGLTNDDSFYGSLVKQSNGDTHAFVYAGGAYTDFSAAVLGNALGGISDINASGAIAGAYYVDATHPRGFIYQNRVLTTLGTIGSGLSSSSEALNNAGKVVGNATIDAAGSHTHAFLYENGQMFDLGLPPPVLGLTYTESFAEDINDTGTIVGHARLGSGDPHALIWHAGSTSAIDLTTLIDSSGAGWALDDAVRINNAGVIVGEGLRADGNYAMFMLTPLPEPAAAGGTFIATVLLLRRRARCYHASRP